MKHFKNLIIIFFIFSLVIVSCKKSITEPEENTIVGKWTFSSAKLRRIVTTNSDQIAKLPYSGIGVIKIKDVVTTTELNGLFLNNTNPLSIGVYRIEYEDYISTVLLIDDNSKFAIVYFAITDKTYTGIINYFFDGDKLVIFESRLTNEKNANNTITISGEISFETVNIEANNPDTIEVPAFQTQYPKRFMNYEFLNDGTFIRIINNTDGPVTNTGFWESSGSTITTTITEDNYTDVNVYEYSINDNFLTVTELYDFCENSQEPSTCLNDYEDLFQISRESLTKVMMESTIFFRKVNDLN